MLEWRKLNYYWISINKRHESNTTYTWRFALFAGSSSSIIGKFSSLFILSILHMHQYHENFVLRLLHINYLLYNNARVFVCVRVCMCWFNKCENSYLVLIIANNLHFSLMIEIARRSRSIDIQDYKGLYANLSKFYGNKHWRVKSLNRSVVHYFTEATIFYEAKCFFFFRQIIVGEHFYSRVSFPFMMYPWIITIKVHSRDLTMAWYWSLSLH